MRFGEPLTDAVARVAKEELGVSTTVGALLGYIEYPSHYENGLDSPVGLAFSATITGGGELPHAANGSPQSPTTCTASRSGS